MPAILQIPIPELSLLHSSAANVYIECSNNMENNFTIPQTVPVKDWVHAFWQTKRQNKIFSRETIIPKGTVEIIFNFYDTADFYAQLNKEVFHLPKCFIQGFHTSPIQIYLGIQQTFFGVVLHTAAAKYILGFPAGEFANSCIDLALIDVSFNSLWHRLAEQNTFDERITVFSDWLLQRLPELSSRDLAFNEFLNTHTNNDLSVAATAQWFCYSPRQLSRKLQELTGMNTEQTLLYKKYLHALHLIHHSNLSLTEIAYACNFSDQSHFIKTFKTFTMLAPNEYKQRKSNITGHFFENVR